MKKKLFFISAVAASMVILGACASVPEKTTSQVAESLPAAQGSLISTPQEMPVEQLSGFQKFTAQDLDGNTVDEKIFADTDLTMINIWGTFCSPCLREMPELGKLNQEYDDKTFQVVGIVMDVFNYDGSISDEQVSYAKEIVSKTQAHYLHLLPSEDLINAKLKDVYGIPETIFVDKTGKIVGESYMGPRDQEQWKAIIDQTLQEIQ